MALPKHGLSSDLAAGTIGVKATFWRDKPGTFAKRPQRRQPPATGRRTEILAVNAFLMDLWPTLSATAQAAWEDYAAHQRKTTIYGSFRLPGSLLFIARNLYPYDERKQWFELPPWLDRPPLLASLQAWRVGEGDIWIGWDWSEPAAAAGRRIDLWAEVGNIVKN